MVSLGGVSPCPCNTGSNLLGFLLDRVDLYRKHYQLHARSRSTWKAMLLFDARVKSRKCFTLLASCQAF